MLKKKRKKQGKKKETHQKMQNKEVETVFFLKRL